MQHSMATTTWSITTTTTTMLLFCGLGSQMRVDGESPVDLKHLPTDYTAVHVATVKIRPYQRKPGHYQYPPPLSPRSHSHSVQLADRDPMSRRDVLNRSKLTHRGSDQPAAQLWFVYEIPLGHLKTHHHDGTQSRDNHNRTNSSTTIALRLRHNTELFASGFTAHSIGPDAVPIPIAVDRREYLTGDVVGAGGWSQVSLHHDRHSGMLTGHINWGSKLYIIEPAATFQRAHMRSASASASGSDHNRDRHFVVYDADAVEISSLHADVDGRPTVPTCGGGVRPPGARSSSYISSREKSAGQGGPREKRGAPTEGSDTCGMAVIADTRFLAQQGSNVATATQAMLTAIE